jgi:hypothetical protein
LRLPQSIYDQIGFGRGLPAIFVHTPKCGGSFIAEGIGYKRERHCFTRRYPLLKGHKTFLEYREIFPKFGLNIDNFLTFSVVRNPWSWHVSFYHYVRQLEGRNREKAERNHRLLNRVSFSEYLDWIDSPEALSRNEIASVHNVCDWVVDETGKVAVDVVMRQECLEADFQKFIEEYGLRLSVPKKRVNASKHDDYRTYYSDNDAEVVGRRHARDIELFKYSFGGWADSNCKCNG